MKKLIAAVVLLSASTATFAAVSHAAPAPCQGSCPHCHHHG